MLKFLFRRSQLMILLGLSVVLSLMTFFTFGAIPLRLMRRNWRSVVYWSLGLFVTALFLFSGLWLQGLMFLSLVSMVDLSRIMEGKTKSITFQVLAASLSVAIVTYFGLLVGLSLQGMELSSELEKLIVTFIDQLSRFNAEIKIEASAVLIQIPSIFVSILIIAQFVSMIFEQRLSQIFSQMKLFSKRFDLAQFRVNELFVWPLIVSFLFSFMHFDLVWVEFLGVNVFNILTVLYFFQGLAIIVYFFQTYKVGLIWQILLIILLIGQLFVIVSVIGVIDYWVDFRKRIEKKGISS